MKHAIVAGASLAGLCAAQALSRFFERVTLIERDAIPAGADDRPGVPQARHVHALLARGLVELERLFPGFHRTIVERGAVEMDMGVDAAVLRAYGWAPRHAFGVRLVCASRRLIESVVRELLAATPNVSIRDRTTVTDLVTDGAGGVSGVRIVAREGSPLAADLVVDASGRESRAPAWLRSLGLEPPGETVVDALAGYSTRWFQAPAELPERWWWRAILIEPRWPEDLLGGVLVPVEAGQWMVTLGGFARRYPPTDEAEFTAWLSRLRSPLIAEAVRLAKPVSPVYGNRQMANRLRHYERWKERLDGFVAVGDSVCAFNPVYGQGMTTAAICARVLGETLERTPPRAHDFASVFFRAQAKAQMDAWAMATGADLRLPTTEGARPPRAKLVGRYMQALFLATKDDPVVHRRLFEVLQMLRPISAFFSPAIVARVTASTLRRRLRGETIPSSIPAAPPAKMLAD